VGEERRVRHRIRKATCADVDALVAIERACFRGVYAAHRFDAADFEYYLDQERARMLVAESGRRPIGYVLGWLGGGARRHTSRILSIAVDPRGRRRGLARALVRRFVSIARASGRSVVRTEVWVGNDAARALFESMGFEGKRLLPDYYGRGRHGRRLVKRID
jgi:ribosomal-protein-alanine N-acetyltransferase